MIRMLVVLPAPLTPRKAVTRPGSAVAVKPSRTVTVPYVLVSRWKERVGMVLCSCVGPEVADTNDPAPKRCPVVGRGAESGRAPRGGSVAGGTRHPPAGVRPRSRSHAGHRVPSVQVWRCPPAGGCRGSTRGVFDAVVALLLLLALVPGYGQVPVPGSGRSTPGHGCSGSCWPRRTPCTAGCRGWRWRSTLGALVAFSVLHYAPYPGLPRLRAAVRHHPARHATALARRARRHDARVPRRPGCPAGRGRAGRGLDGDAARDGRGLAGRRQPAPTPTAVGRARGAHPDARAGAGGPRPRGGRRGAAAHRARAARRRRARDVRHRGAGGGRQARHRHGRGRGAGGSRRHRDDEPRLAGGDAPDARGAAPGGRGRGDAAGARPGGHPGPRRGHPPGGTRRDAGRERHGR